MLLPLPQGLVAVKATNKGNRSCYGCHFGTSRQNKEGKEMCATLSKQFDCTEKGIVFKKTLV